MFYSYFFRFLVTSSTILITIFSSVSYYTDYISSHFKPEVLSEYDFVVVGSGSAGAVVAHRLSKHNKVLLLEAGGDPSPLHSIPSYAFSILNLPQTDWMHKTVPQENAALAFTNRQILWPRGKIVGGSSTMNFMMYLHGHPLDFDDWANFTGDSSWSYENVLPFFRKSVFSYKGKFSNNVKHRGSSPYGFLNIEEDTYSLLRKHFIDGGIELGFKEIDVNGPLKSGFGRIEVTKMKGERCGTYFSILKNPKYPNNYRISRYSHAVKIKLDSNNQAIGVHYIRNGIKRFVKATKEVIVSAGTIESAKLLLLSGIGPKKHLQQLNIRSKVDLPVGQNLQDHVLATIMPFSISKPLSFVPCRDFTVGAVFDYAFNGQGFYSSTVGLSAHAFLSSSKILKTGKDWPDIQLYMQAIASFSASPGLGNRAQGLNPEFLERIMEPFYDQDGFNIPIGLMRPKSVGEITLKDKNSFSPPLINPRYLEHPDDVAVIKEGIEWVFKLTEATKVFHEINTTFTQYPVPGCSTFKYRSDKYWECYIRHITSTEWHPVGTCRMGRGIDDPKAVLDSTLRVLKVKHLRVVDASVMPNIVSANTNAATIMIGEKGAHFIQDYWNQQYAVCDLYDYFVFSDQQRCYYSKFV